MKKMKRMAALILSCALAAVCPVMGSQAEEDTRKDFVFGDYVGDVDPALQVRYHPRSAPRPFPASAVSHSPIPAVFYWKAEAHKQSVPVL